ncbi:MAG: GTPase HflX [Dehalococcoidia bacterium]|nr:GTPase HflX [Dehalococcoidia bacterium]
MVSTGNEAERALLVSVSGGRRSSVWTPERSLEELAHLASTAGAVVIGTMTQHLDRPGNTYLGKGKLEELVALKETAGYTLVICDDELSPAQQQSMEDSVEVKVLDRTALILDIFARSARTREGRLQVELAQHEYLLPRLAGQWSHLERLGGGIGTRGPGESQLETDRRLIRGRISRLKKDLERVRIQRSLYREQRRQSGVSVVSLVGYTNAGKSTLFNRMGRAKVLAENKLFSTLDPISRRVVPPEGRPFLLTDTVGFIQKLPHSIIAAFRATLEELEEADLLVHVVDITHESAAEQCQTVENTLKELHVQDKPRITALNKIDLLTARPEEFSQSEDVARLSEQLCDPGQSSVLISAASGFGVDKLLKTISDVLDKEVPGSS